MKLAPVIALACALGTPIYAGQNAGGPASSSPAQATAVAKIDPAKEADIRRLLDLVGTTSLVRQVVERTEQNLKPVLTNSLPPGDYRGQLVELFFQKFNSKFNSEQLVNLVVVRYDENFSDDEIKSLIGFYQTPLGRKVSALLPKLTTELQEDGQKMGQNIGRQAMIEVLQEHPELAQALQAAAAGRGAAPQQ